MDTDVIIVGAGPTGLALAVELRQRGVTCRVVDQAATASPGTRGFTLKPSTLDVLVGLGVADRIRAAGIVERRLRFFLTPAERATARQRHRARRPLFELEVPTAAGHASVGIPQFRTEAILRTTPDRSGPGAQTRHQVVGEAGGDRGGAEQGAEESPMTVIDDSDAALAQTSEIVGTLTPTGARPRHRARTGTCAPS